MKTTRLIEIDLGVSDPDIAWECEHCGGVWQYVEDGPEENDIRYCSFCGRRITEYVKLGEAV